MATGFMELQLVKAKELCDTDFFGSMNPYVVIQYNGQERRSSFAKGNNPVWNEKFVFKVEYPTPSNSYKVILKIMGKDLLSADDCVGQAISYFSLYVEDLLAIGVGNDGAAEVQPLKYRVIRADQSYCGEFDIGITKIEEEFNGETK